MNAAPLQDAALPVASAGAPRPRRVATVLPSLYPTYGLERLVISQAEEYLQLGLETDIVCLNEPHDVSGLLPPGCRLFNLGVPQIRNALGPLRRYLRAERPDAVHAALWPVTCLTAVAHRLARLPGRIVLSDHNPLSLQYASRGSAHRLLQRVSVALTYPLASARICVSGGVADDLSRLSGLPRRWFSVVHNPVAIGLPEPAAQQAAEAAWGGWHGKRILTVGRLKAQKNHALLLRAFKQVLARVDARLMILGEGDLGPSIAELARSEGLEDKVLMPGHVDDPISYYLSSDLFTLSSDYEGFGNVIVEALGCGVPVVSTDCPGGPAEILEGGRYGRLVPVGDASSLASAMVAALLEPPDRRLLMSRAADFAPRVVTRKYLDLMFPAGEQFAESSLTSPSK
ncbi:glycosyltransferase [Ramlibacter montanisoli]|uniref:Glycosyltransferase n=1 Tax=Ramlibacter montanisoli TaxID=2732512 RepID=A0A849KPE5_9BURK|nr:glycosyltransferase [Ramlibacter montanisoli]NNU43669.1 glycosyltransferase [Ramlibacter montanisoli]